MRPDLFTAPGRFHRGNLHAHSTLSDGALSPQEVCRRYRAEGYDFIALTDHFIGRYGYPIADTAPFRAPGFTTLLGAEIHSGAMENGAFVAVAHPQWSALTLADARSIDAAHAIEVYNHGCHVGADRADGFHMLDLLLSEGRDLTAVATDDAHFTEPDHFGGWVMVKARDNAPEALLAALKAGAFYSSQGPELRGIRRVGDVLEVECSAAASVIVQGCGSAATAVHGASMTAAEVPLGRLANSPWLRVTVADRAGKRAWSNPMRG